MTAIPNRFRIPMGADFGWSQRNGGSTRWDSHRQLRRRRSRRPEKTRFLRRIEARRSHPRGERVTRGMSRP